MSSGRFRRGSTLGKYRLERRLGQGAFAQVWKARDRVENRFVALKIVFAEAVAEVGREGIEQEARIASRLSHPNIVALRNADWIDGLFVLATDLADRSLASYPAVRRSPLVALRVIRQVAAGLAHAHSRRILHLDLKPANIMIFAHSGAAIGDFGTSRLVTGTRTYADAGTLGYIAPEQAYGRAGWASDVFSLGLMAYEILTGRLLAWPFAWPAEGYERFVERVPEPLRPVLKKAAAFDPRHRYPDGMSLHGAIEAAFERIERPKPAPVRRRSRRLAPSPLAIEANLFRRRDGAGLGMRYACHHCEAPIAESMSHCPWCGTADNSFREVTSFSIVCPECERGVLPEWKACPWCFPGRFAGNGRPAGTDPRAVRNCSRRGCDGQLRPFMRYCPQCKQKTRRLWSHEGLPDRCPRCRWPVSREFWRYCPWCGRREPRAGTFVRRRGRVLKNQGGTARR